MRRRVRGFRHHFADLEWRSILRLRHIRPAPLLLLIVLAFRAHAQTEQLLPEIDTYYKLNSEVRFELQAKQTREGGEPTTAEIGPSVDFYVSALTRLLHIVAFDPDDSKVQPLVFSIGYRYLPTPNEPPTNRMEPVATLNFQFPKTKIQISDRNRWDLDWKNSRFTWRYRNRVQIERSVRIRSYRVSPYGSVEFFYQSQYAKWSETAIYAGCLFPIGKHVRFDPYYEHQNNTGKRPNQRLDQLGLVLALYF